MHESRDTPVMARCLPSGSLSSSWWPFSAQEWPPYEYGYIVAGELLSSSPSFPPAITMALQLQSRDGGKTQG